RCRCLGCGREGTGSLWCRRSGLSGGSSSSSLVTFPFLLCCLSPGGLGGVDPAQEGQDVCAVVAGCRHVDRVELYAQAVGGPCGKLTESHQVDKLVQVEVVGAVRGSLWLLVGVVDVVPGERRRVTRTLGARA